MTDMGYTQSLSLWTLERTTTAPRRPLRRPDELERHRSVTKLPVEVVPQQSIAPRSTHVWLPPVVMAITFFSLRTR
jgi:hypothetical protein